MSCRGCEYGVCPVHGVPAPSPQPEMPEGWVHAQTQGGSFVHARYTLPMWLIEQLLATQGLAIVPAAVAKACEALDESALVNMTSDDYYAPEYCHDLGQAIIAWRKEKG